MAHPLVVLAVCSVHHALRYTSFVESLIAVQARPSNWSCVVLAAICMLLLDAEDDWYRYRRRLTVVPRLAVDVCAAFVAFEFGMVTIWSRLEQAIRMLVATALLGQSYADDLAVMLIAIMALFVLVNAARVTGWWSNVGQLTLHSWTRASLAVADIRSGSTDTGCGDVVQLPPQRSMVDETHQTTTAGTSASAPLARTIKIEPVDDVPTVLRLDAAPADARNATHKRHSVTPYRMLHPSRARRDKPICLLCEGCA